MPCLLVVGDGPDRAAVEESAGRKLGDRAVFTGVLDSVADVYAAIDVLVLTSATEGMPGVMIEAALSGVPVVAPDVGAVRWLFDNDVPGEPVSVEATPQEYCAAILRVSELPQDSGPGCWRPVPGTRSSSNGGRPWMRSRHPTSERLQCERHHSPRATGVASSSQMATAAGQLHDRSRRSAHAPRIAGPSRRDDLWPFAVGYGARDSGALATA